MNWRNNQDKTFSRNGLIAVACSFCVIAMLGAAYAAVPLYRLFCQVTGFGGTIQIAEKTSDKILERKITIRFDANVARTLEWRFAPAQKQMTLKIGENGLAFYKAVNLTTRKIAGTAVFNVTPLEAGAYFNKTECFCFTKQVLKPGEHADMPVSFYIDPAIVKDPALKNIDTITLSYTFFPIQKSARLAPDQE